MSEQYYFKVNGMKCEGCAEAVEKAVKKLGGVVSIEVDLDSSMVVVNATVSARSIGDAIDEAGFNAILIPE
ncbi:MAG TPA: heavy-metal-associated domain-containing protein [Gammaproteobacteria bacterium]|nr:heavy-metal-associated domain-containing protein [Gammaproteobacteria bacterium]